MKAIIIGNSAAGLNALETFRSYDKNSSITLISKEKDIAYSKVLLPYFLRGKTLYENLFIRSETYYEERDVQTYFGTSVMSVNDKERYVILDEGKKLFYDRLLVASGSSPINPPTKNLEGPGVFHLWTLEDMNKMKHYFVPGKRLLVIGSGLVSLQSAWSAVSRGLNVKVYARSMPKFVDEEAADILKDQILSYGVDFRTKVLIDRIERNKDGSISVYPDNSESFVVDFIIVGTGVRPNCQFLKGTEVGIDRGIMVNDRMETSSQNIYAAGDVAQGPSILANKGQITYALWSTAVEHGKVAGANMAGKDCIYEGALNMNVTQMFGITVASVGEYRDIQGLNKYVVRDAKNKSYRKIILKNNIPVGGAILGKSDDVAKLGALKPLIKKKKEINNIEKFLTKHFLFNMYSKM